MNEIITTSQLRQCAEKSRGYASGLMVEFAEATADAIEEIDTKKADKASALVVSMQAGQWEKDPSGDYPYRYDIPAQGITPNDKADIVILPDSLSTARDCVLCPVSQTLDGCIRIRSARAPQDTIKIQYWINKGR